MRTLLDLWDEAADQAAKDHIKNLLDGGSFVFFFKKGKDLFAAPEGSRIVFATFKNPDDETPKGWAEEANMSAIDLDQALQGNMVNRIFSKKDIKDMEVMDSDSMYKLLVKKADHSAKINLAKVIKNLPQDDDDEDIPTNMDDLEEK